MENIRFSLFNKDYIGFVLSRLFLLLFCALFGDRCYGQQMFSFQQIMGTYVPVSAGVTIAEATGNTTSTNLTNKYYQVNLPFVYHYIGLNYTSIYVSTNGFITLENPPVIPSQNNPINYNNTTSAIAAFAGSAHGMFDINGATSRIKTAVEGVAPNRQFIIEWQNFSPGAGVATTNVYAMSYQIRLEETTNKVSIIYGGGSHLVGTQNYVGQVQVGIRGAGPNYYNNRKSDAGVAFTNSIGGDTSGSNQYINTASSSFMPPAGLTYVWTPPACNTPYNIVAANVTDTSADVSWSVNSMPSDGFEYYINNNGNSGPPLASSWVTGTSATASVHLNNLSPNTTHYFWVRSLCGNVRSDWSLLGTFQTLCGAVSSVSENFDSYSTGQIVPNCWVRLMGSDVLAQTISGAAAASGANELRQKANVPAEANVVILPSLNNLNAGTHWLRFKARTEVGESKMDVGYITNINDASTFVNVQSLLFDNLDYNSASEYMVQFPTNIPSTARIAIRNDGLIRRTFFYDDVFWESIPACSPAVGLKLVNVAHNSAEVNWTASLVPPSNGYDIYLSTSDVSPAVNTNPLVVGHSSNNFMFNNLQPLTTYYVWIRSNCGSGLVGDWIWRPLEFRTNCSPSVLISTTGTTICKDGTAIISAVADGGANVIWYDAPVGGNVLGVGNTYTTPPLTTTTTYYAAASMGIGEVRGAKISPASSAVLGTNLSSLVFNIGLPSVLKKVTIYPLAEASGWLGTVTIALSDASNVVIAQKKVEVVAGTLGNPLANEVELDFEIPVGNNYRLHFVSKSGDIQGLMYDANILNNGITPFPYTLGGYGSVNSSQIYANTPIYYPYYYFYDWVLNGGCESARQPVVVAVDTNCLSTEENLGTKDFKIYPNPFTDKINLSNKDKVTHVELMDSVGRRLGRVKFDNGTLDLSHLNSGMYFINLYLKDGSKSTVKVIKK